jgi:hypothetical protein
MILDQSKRCAWCGQKRTAKGPSVVIRHADDGGRVHRLAWCLGTGCTDDPVYRAVCATRPRISKNALMVLAERRRDNHKIENGKDGE